MILATTLLVLLSLTPVYCDCPTKKIIYQGHCSYWIKCSHSLNSFTLEPECLGSSNYNTSIDITVSDASDTLDQNANPNVLQSITALTVFGNWSETSLPFLENMFQLKTLNVVSSKIEYITGSPFRYLNLIESICLSHNLITDIDDLFEFDSGPGRLKTLSLSYNRIRDLKYNHFEDLSSLIELDLSNNFISDLTDEPFKNLTNLVILRLNNNRIRDINGALKYTINLKHLYLRYNNIAFINEESIARIDHLETFDISNNELREFEPVMLFRHWLHFANHSTCRILLSDNQIVFIPNTTLTDPNIVRPVRNAFNTRVNVEVNLSKNQISQIEYNAFQAVTHLTSLDVSNNKLMTFILNPEHLQYMMYLNLSGNLLRRLHYQSFSAMRGLQNLDLSYNYIDYFPDESIGESELERVNLTYNNIASIESLKLKFHSHGGVLDLSNNGLSTLSVPQDEAFGLTELILSSNNITDLFLIQLNSQHRLVRLNVSQNHIQELNEKSLQLPISMNYLDLSSNKIHVISPSSFQNVGHLNTLKLSHNEIREIVYGAFSGLALLHNLDLSYNYIDFLDSKYLMDLQSLRVLSLRHNGLHYLDHNSWLSHKFDLLVYLDDNNYSCDWLATVLKDYNNGYSKMRPMAVKRTASGHAIDNIPCEQNDNQISSNSKYILSDDRLLVMSQKILEVLKEQTTYLKKIVPV